MKNILKEEIKFRKKLMSIKPRSSIEAIWLPAFLTQSMLFEMTLRSLNINER
jgi:hypothetical protein